MTEKHKKRLCYLAGYKSVPFMCKQNPAIELYVLIKAMWAINRGNGKLKISQDIDNDYFVISSLNTLNVIIFPKDKYNNSELEALQAALLYVLDNE